MLEDANLENSTYKYGKNEWNNLQWNKNDMEQVNCKLTAITVDIMQFQLLQLLHASISQSMVTQGRLMI